MLHSKYSKAEDMKREIPVSVGDQTLVVKPAACQYADRATYLYFTLYFEKFIYRKTHKKHKKRIKKEEKEE
jgi:hypothetical protein